MVSVHELYMAPDKNLMQQKMEIQDKKIRKAFCEETGMAVDRVFANKNEGYLAIDYVPVAKVLVSQHAAAILYWNHTVAEAHDVEREAVQANFAALSKAQNVEWTL